MKAHLLRFWEKLNHSFWFVPALMAAGAVLLSFVALAMDRQLSEGWLQGSRWIYPTGMDGARELLAVIAGSMITVAGVVFSITIVALSLASQQMGPRLLRNFMRDTGNQVVLGTFIATFLYCLMILRTIHETEEGAFVPHASVGFAAALSLASLGVLIYFIHHVSMSIQAPNVIASVGRDLVKAVEEMYPEGMGVAAAGNRGEKGVEVPDGFDKEAQAVSSATTGYLQAIDADSLLRLATDHDLLLRIETRPGHFIYHGHPLVRAWPAESVTDELVKRINFAFVVGPHRTPTQDIEFALDQLVEVGVRALSAGINDPFTAMACIDWLGAALYRVAQHEDPSPYRLDKGGRLRLIVTSVSSFRGMADAAFNQLRQQARGDVAVTCRLLETIAQIADACRDPGFKSVLLHHATLILRSSVEWPEEYDRRDAQDRFQAVEDRLQAVGEPHDGPQPLRRK